MKFYYFIKALWDGQGKIKMYYGMSGVKKQATIGKKVYYKITPLTKQFQF